MTPRPIAGRVAAPAVLLGALALASCSSGAGTGAGTGAVPSESGSGATPSASPTTSPSAGGATGAASSSTTEARSASPSTSAACLAATDVGSAILGGAKGTELTLVDAAAVRAPGGEAYYVAVRFTAGGSEAVGVWTTTTLEPGVGTALSADSVARTVTFWPHATSSSGAPVADDDPSVLAAAACLH